MNSSINFKLVLFIAIVSINTATARCTIEEWQALQAFYISTNGDNWDKKDGWENILDDEPPVDCNFENFYGVDEINDAGNIIEFFFSDNNLTGSIPSEIAKLKYLEKLNIDNHIGLSGEIPSSLGKLNNLIWIDLSANQLTGSIPPELGNLNNLSTLNLSFNQLSGNIPPELSDMPNLYILNLFTNNLTGSIPPEFGDSRFIAEGAVLLFAFNNLRGCYDINLKKLCGKLAPPTSEGYITFSVGNNFDAEWEDFCETGAGTCDTINRCHPTDWQALQNIYQSYGGSNWQNTTGWDSLIVNQDSIPINCNLDNLYGVSTSVEGRVDSIDLSNNQLNGEFTADWLTLDSLTYLNVADNNLSGCFDSLAIGLCEQLDSPYFVSDSLVDKGNDFEATWDFFCTYQSCDTTSTSIFNFELYQPLNIFPNPATEYIYIKSGLPLSVDLNYQIISINGKLLGKSIIETEKINIANLESGTYFLIATDGKKTFSSRFIKM